MTLEKVKMNGNGGAHKTIITILLAAISILLTFFAVSSQENRNEITTIKIARAAEQERLKIIERDVTAIRKWVEQQKTK